MTKREVACKPATCPTCGSTECIERPRFFSGQLLTDRDLDAAQRYVIEKNRLHNRYLVGTGVACGLAVRCDRCDSGSVVVQPGYAIDCCGNDIVLCEPVTFNVYEALNGCKPKKDPCGPSIGGYNSPCDDVPSEYYLVLYYNEEHTSPVTALMRNGCSNVRCEPSRTKETYRLEVIAKEDYEARTQPNMWKNIVECIRATAEQVKTYWAAFSQIGGINGPQQHTALVQLFCRMREAVQKMYQLGVNNRCTLAAELAAIEQSLPVSTNDPNYSQKMMTALVKLFGYMMQYMLDCICDKLLVPCSPCDGDEGVVLACLTLSDCKVQKVCNICRTQLLTGPSVRYWLQPVFAGVGNLLERLCCEFDLVDLFGPFIYIETPTNPTPPQPGVPVTGAKAFAGGDFNNESNDASYTTGGGMPSYEPGVGADRISAFTWFAQDYTTKPFGVFDAAAILPLFSSETLTVLDLYGKNLATVAPLLQQRKVEYTTVTAKDDTEAYSFGNLGKMSWAIPSGGSVEIMLDNRGLISAIRRKEDHR